jgi:hypothetical protein
VPAAAMTWPRPRRSGMVTTGCGSAATSGSTGSATPVWRSRSSPHVETTHEPVPLSKAARASSPSVGSKTAMMRSAASRAVPATTSRLARSAAPIRGARISRAVGFEPEVKDNSLTKRTGIIATIKAHNFSASS